MSNYIILPPEKEGQRWYVIPASEEAAKQILQFIKNKTPELLKE